MAKRQHSSTFKTKVVVEALTGIETVAALAQKYAVHPSQIQNWKAQALAGLPEVFRTKKSYKNNDLQEKEELERKVGQLTMENDFLKKKFCAYQEKRGNA